jgi:hypothetical protein
VTSSGVSRSYGTPEGATRTASPTRTETLPEVPTTSASATARRAVATSSAQARASSGRTSLPRGSDTTPPSFFALSSPPRRSCQAGADRRTGRAAVFRRGS